MDTAAEINRSFDLLALAEKDTALKHAGSGWWAGPCPFCGGTDRFTLKQTPSGWRWYCRHCGGDRYHTALDYIIRRRSWTIPEALRWAASPPSPQGNRFDSPPICTQTGTAGGGVSSLPIDRQIWQTRGVAFMETCAANLPTKLGVSARAWLHNRGLNDDTITHYRLGYNPSDIFEPLSAWGITSSHSQHQTVWLPRGIVIPCWEDDQLWYLKIRRPVPTKSGKIPSQKYIKVKGSQPGLFGAWNLRGAWLAVLTEGELDCILLDQQAGDLAGVATLGSAADRITRLDLSIWGKWILPTAHILVAYDLDAPGAKGSRALESFTERAIHAPLPDLPGVKDLTDFHTSGGDLSDWLCRTVETLHLLD